MIIRPFEELEAMARKRYKAHYAQAPEPQVINLEALVQFHRPQVERRFEVGGIGLRAPPLPFLSGVRLLIAANALRALLEADIAPPGAIPSASRDAARYLAQASRPIRLRDRLRGRWLARIIAAGPEALEQGCRFVLHCPDDSAFPPASQSYTFDFMDAVVGVVERFPSWMDPTTGLPRLWSHYVYGSRHLSRERARIASTMHDAVSMAIAGAFAGEGQAQQNVKAYHRDLRAAAGW